MTKKKQSLSEQMAHLEEIVQSLDNQKVDLESGLARFKEGVTLIKEIKTRLSKTENEFLEAKKELDDLFEE
jgi:exodeoxyribonuclease VII small subunit